MSQIKQTFRLWDYAKGDFKETSCTIKESQYYKLLRIKEELNKLGLKGVLNIPSSIPIIINLNNKRKQITTDDTIQIIIKLREMLEPIKSEQNPLLDENLNLRSKSEYIRETIDMCKVSDLKEIVNNFKNPINNNYPNDKDFIKKMDIKRLNEYIKFQEGGINYMRKELNKVKKYRREKFNQ